GFDVRVMKPRQEGSERQIRSTSLHKRTRPEQPPRLISWGMLPCTKHACAPADVGSGSASHHCMLRRARDTSKTTYVTSAGQGTMVDFTVFIAMASATARPMPSSVKG